MALALLLAIPMQAWGQGALLRLEEGVARNPSSAAELFREQHWIRSQGDQTIERLVIYRCPDGTAFGRKRIDYRVSALAPDFVFDDQRSGYREGLRQGARPTLFFRPDARTAERAVQLPSARLVADAGFDEFIRRNWPGLVAGETLSLSFAVPSRQRSLPFSVARLGQGTLAGEKAWIFRLRLGGWAGWIVPPIDVSYGQESRRLLRFEGLSNLRDDGGDQPVVARIDFAQPASAATEAAWKAALETPLSACRAGR